MRDPVNEKFSNLTAKVNDFIEEDCMHNGKSGQTRFRIQYRCLNGETAGKERRKSRWVLKDDNEKQFFVTIPANWVTRSLESPLPSFLRESIRFKLVRMGILRVESAQIFIVTGRVWIFGSISAFMRRRRRGCWAIRLIFLFPQDRITAKK